MSYVRAHLEAKCRRRKGETDEAYLARLRVEKEDRQKWGGDYETVVNAIVAVAFSDAIEDCV